MKTNLELAKHLRTGKALYNPYFGTILVWMDRHFYKCNPGSKTILTWKQVRQGLKQCYWKA